MTNKTAWTAWAVKNSIVVICFTALAVHFNHWWIVLFAVLLTSSLETKRFPSRICDGCGRTIYAEDMDIDRALAQAGWVRRKYQGKWEDLCPRCQQRFGSVVGIDGTWQSYSEKLREERHETD